MTAPSAASFTKYIKIKEPDACNTHIVLSDDNTAAARVTRPSLVIEEIDAGDGSKMPGDTFWTPCYFTAISKPRKVIGRYSKIDLEISKTEMWVFGNATIMLISETDTPRQPQPLKWQYIIVFESVHRE